MANNGPKFVSVNLNKSYGQPHHFPHYNGGGGAGRGRSVGGTSGGMVVLSRNRGMAPKAVPKLSIPPPLNLPSLRKEHEKYDMLGPGGSGVGVGNSGASRPTSSSVGWTKPTANVTEKNSSGVDTPGALVDPTVGAGVISGSYMPPSARTGAVGVMSSALRDIHHSADKAIVLRGEDFPTLQAARPVSSGTGQKQMDLKQKHAENEDLNMGRKSSSDSQQSGLTSMNNVGSHVSSLMKNGEYLPDPLPLVRMTPRSDWADDERDTGHGFVEHERETGFQKSENYWDRDFDFPRPSFPPYKPIHRQYERRGRDSEVRNTYSSEVRKIDAYNRDLNEVNQEGKEVDKWRPSSLSRDGSQETAANYGVDVRRRMTAPGNILKENKYIPPHHGDTSRDANNTGNRDSLFGRRDLSSVGRQHPNNSVESFNNPCNDRVRQEQHLSDHHSRFRGDNYQHNSFSNPLVGSSGKMGPMVDPIMTMGRDKRFLRSDNAISEGKPPLRDISAAVFDEKDVFLGDVVGIIKRKKDATKITDIHDPVRESFEAELERVQKMQELERQRIVEEQERALEQAQREKEERERRIQEEEEQMRRLEEEAREAAWRAEQDQLEAIRRAEEQRISREEERKRFQMEEERRLQAAKQKLLEVEARMARRQADAAKADAPAGNSGVYEKLDAAAKETYAPRKPDMDSWENGKGMVENVKTSGSFDSSASNRPEANSKPYPRGQDSSNIHERGKASSSWRKDITENDGIFPSPFSNLDAVHSRPRYDIRGSSQAAPSKEFHGGTQYITNRDLLNVGESESTPDDFGYGKDRRWNIAGNMDSYTKHKLADSELHNDIAEKYGDNGWGFQNSRSHTRPMYNDRMFPTAEANDAYVSGRSRYSLRQPRVLPPPSLAPAQRTTTVPAENAGQAIYSDNVIRRTHEARNDRGGDGAYYDHSQQILESSDAYRLQRDDITSGGQKLENESGCASQSSLSVSSPPASPPHLSHDELDEFEDSYVLSRAENERNLLRGNDSLICNSDNGNSATVIVSDSLCRLEDEEWTPENDYTLQQQEEYDEDENDHRENDDLRDADENTEIQKFGQTHEETELSDIQNNVVLGFDEGVEVEIPNDDFENILETQQRLVAVAGSSFGFVDESWPVDALSVEGKSILSAGDSLKESAGSSSKMVTAIHVPECSTQQISTPSHVDCVDFSDASVFNGQKRVSVGVNNGINRTQDFSSLTQGDLPVKLQFGLFSGTSIQSPMPAIQIGSIQMPLHTHSPVISSITHMNPSQPPMLQFGQLHHSSSSSQVILPIAPQLIPRVLPNAAGQLSLNQDAGACKTRESGQNASTHKVARDIMSSVSLNDQQGLFSASTTKVDAASSHDKTLSGTGFLVEDSVDVDAASKNILTSARGKRTESQLPRAQPVMQPVFVENNFAGMRRFKQVSGGRGRRFTYAMKNGHTRLSNHGYNTPADTYDLQRRPRRIVQRREYRIREKEERQPTQQLVYSNGIVQDDKPNSLEKSSVAFSSNGSKRTAISKRSMKQKTEIWSSSGRMVSQRLNSGDSAVKDSSVKTQDASQFGEVNLRQNAVEDVDALLQSGVVRVFKQPGIECPSDEDDFVKVRSKRQMLNDRREQREKEIKAKSLTTKSMHKPHVSRQKDAVPRSQGEGHAPLSGNTTQVALPAQAATASQPPIAKCQDNSETQSIKPSHSSPVGIFSSGGSAHGHVQMLDTKDTEISMGPHHIDEAMKSARHGSHVSTVGGHSSTVGDALLEVPLPSVAEDKTFSGASSINMITGEKIQFGAVTSPVFLPHSGHILSHGIGAPALSQGDIMISKPFPGTVKDASLFYEKDKHLSSSHAPKQDSEAEAASAIAVVASSNKMVMNDLAAVKDTKGLGGLNISQTGTGVVGYQKSPSQSRADEFSVSLPEDLSIETTPISLWPPLPSPQSSSGQMLSHFTSGPHTHFPFYDMNPILGGPIFALSHTEESSGAQPQPQNNTALASGPLGNWQHHHSNVDSFYGHPSGYSGPFVGPPGNIPGVQGAPMVVYNHFPPVGQYGHQVGVGFMGAATYIPPGKQADWKNSSTSVEGDVKNVNVTNMQRNAPSMAPPFQHLAPGSPLLPVPSAVPVFDKSPFQTAPDLSVQACLVPLHSVPISRPLQSQDEGALHSQVNHGFSIEQSVTIHRPTESRVPTTTDTSSSFPAFKDVNVGGVLDESLGASAAPSVQNITVQSSSVTADAESIKIKRSENDEKQNIAPVKTQQYSQRNGPPQHGNTSSGYNFQRGGGISQRNNQGNDWSQRRVSFYGRNQSSGGDRGFPAVKPKQIYVAKKTSNSSS